MATITVPIQVKRGVESSLPTLLGGEFGWTTDTHKLYIGDGSTNHRVDGGATSPLTTKGDVWVYASADARLPVGSDGQVLSADSTQTTGLKWIPSTGSPGGSDKQVQFNDSGAFGGDSGLTFDKSSGNLAVVGPLDVYSAGQKLRVQGFGGSYFTISQGPLQLFIGNTSDLFIDNSVSPAKMTLGTGSTYKLGFWGVTPVAQPATTGTTSGTSGGSSGTVLNTDATATGGVGSAAYTLGDVVLALKQAGILAA